MNEEELLKKINETLFGKLSFENDKHRVGFLVGKINENVKPPKPVTAQNVNIRAIYLVNDLINSHGGRFDNAELNKLRDLIIDTPILIGHNRKEAPMARSFYAELVKIGKITWLKSYFYWPNSGDSSDDKFLRNIDAGVFKECSISFSYTTPECSECGEDIRNCPHDNNSGDTHFYYRGVTQVFETSVVFKGSVKGTYITDQLDDDKMFVRLQTDNLQIKLTIDSHDLSDNKVSILPLNLSIVKKLKIVADDNINCAMAVKNGNAFLLVRNRKSA